VPDGTEPTAEMKKSAKSKDRPPKELPAAPRRFAELEVLKAEWKRSGEGLQKVYEVLERCIEERTSELLQTNEQLKQEIEERKRAEGELKRTKDYLENVIDNSVDAIGIVDRHGRFILWNRRAAEIYGFSFAELTGKTAFDLYADAEELMRMLARLRQDGVVREHEIVMRKKDGNVVPMDISISLLKDDQGCTMGSVCVARDLSERKKAEAELKRAKEELDRYSRDLERQVKERTREISSILRYTPSVVYIKNKGGQYKLVNSRFAELFGVTNKEIQGKSDHEIFSRECADQLRANDQKVLRDMRPQQVEEAIPQSDGIHVYLSVKFPLYDEEGAISGLCGISTDITALKKAQDQLRRLSGSIMNSQEKERRIIARELHDELGQLLTALRMDSVWIYGYLQKHDGKAAERALSMCNLIDHTIDEVRGLATRLRPGVLDDLGLIEALEWYITEFEKRTGIACIFTHRQAPEVDGIIATAAYRIAQEALTNVARHSFATQAQVTLQAEAGILTLAVVDNGRGFNIEELAESQCLGLVGMRERAGLLGGSLEMRSRPGMGTQVYFRLPLNGEEGRVS
jgi:PAS domain S-box-containing protein